LKKIFCFAFIIIFIFSLCSCGENMKDLLEYQDMPISARVKISDKKREFEAIITVISENERKIKLLSPKNLENVEISFINGQKYLFSDGLEIQISTIDKENDNFYRYTEIFCLSKAGQWKIKKGKYNGYAVNICDNGKIVAYISAKPKNPVRFEIEEAVIEVIEIIR